MTKNEWVAPIFMHLKIVTIITCLFLLCPVHAKPYTVVIDAGHGGKDGGAVGPYHKLLEKDVNLDISLRLASKLRTAYPDMEVILTRSSDIFLPLQQRADIVNENNADLFICIHTNSSDYRSARGAETYILGTEHMEDNLDVAMRENAVMKLESNYQTAYQGFDPNSVDSYIMFELMQNQYMDQSLHFASLVQSRLISDLNRNDRGVRQAAFWVLLKSACPSVLIEVGFISNKEEEQYLKSDTGKKGITESIFHAFTKYYNATHSNQTPAKNDTIKPTTTTPKESDVKKDTLNEPTTKKNKSTEPDKKKDESKSKEVAKSVEAAFNRDTIQSSPTANPADTIAKPIVHPKTIFRVQIFSVRQVLPPNDREFKGLKNCTYIQRDEWYKYMYGNCTTEAEAEELRKTLINKFPSCFVVEVQP